MFAKISLQKDRKIKSKLTTVRHTSNVVISIFNVQKALSKAREKEHSNYFICIFCEYLSNDAAAVAVESVQNVILTRKLNTCPCLRCCCKGTFKIPSVLRNAKIIDQRNSIMQNNFKYVHLVLLLLCLREEQKFQRQQQQKL
jgi:hypothetical protein